MMVVRTEMAHSAPWGYYINQTLIAISILLMASLGTEAFAQTSGHTARGVIEANAEVTLGAGIVAQITSMPLKEGDTFNQGDLLVEFDCGRYRAELRGAEARAGKFNMLHISKRQLKQRGAAGSFEVAEAKADSDAANAEVSGLQHTLKFCRITAPFDGRVLERTSDAFEIPGANTPILTVLDVSALEVALIIPSAWLSWVEQGTLFEFSVEETGSKYRAKIVRIGAKVDAVSQTIKIVGMFVEPSPNILPGMSGQADFTPPGN